VTLARALPSLSSPAPAPHGRALLHGLPGPPESVHLWHQGQLLRPVRAMAVIRQTGHARCLLISCSSTAARQPRWSEPLTSCLEVRAYEGRATGSYAPRSLVSQKSPCRSRWGMPSSRAPAAGASPRSQGMQRGRTCRGRTPQARPAPDCTCRNHSAPGPSPELRASAPLPRMSNGPPPTARTTVAAWCADRRAALPLCPVGRECARLKRSSVRPSLAGLCRGSQQQHARGRLTAGRAPDGHVSAERHFDGALAAPQAKRQGGAARAGAGAPGNRRGSR